SAIAATHHSRRRAPYHAPGAHRFAEPLFDRAQRPRAGWLWPKRHRPRPASHGQPRRATPTTRDPGPDPFSIREPYIRHAGDTERHETLHVRPHALHLGEGAERD